MVSFPCEKNIKCKYIETVIMKLFGRKQNEIGEEWENLDIKKTKAEDCDWLTS